MVTFDAAACTFVTVSVSWRVLNVCSLLLFFGPPAQSSRHKNWKLSKIMTTACYSVSNVLRKAIAFPLWSAIDSRWNRNTFLSCPRWLRRCVCLAPVWVRQRVIIIKCYPGT